MGLESEMSLAYVWGNDEQEGQRGPQAGDVKGQPRRNLHLSTVLCTVPFTVQVGVLICP